MYCNDNYFKQYVISYLTDNYLGHYFINNNQTLLNIDIDTLNNFKIQMLKDQIQSLEIKNQIQNVFNPLNTSFLSTPNYLSQPQTYVPNCTRAQQKEETKDRVKKKLTSEEIDILLFPINPIRDWAKREEEKIKEKYEWIKELDKYLDSK